MNFYERLQEGHYGSIELKRLIGPNLLRGLVISVALHIFGIGIPWLLYSLRDRAAPEQQIRVLPRLDYTLRTEVEELKREAPKPKTRSDEGGGGGGGGEEQRMARGSRRTYLRLERAADLTPGEDGISFDVVQAHIRTTLPGEDEVPLDKAISSTRSTSRRGTGRGADLEAEEAGAGGADNFGTGAGYGGAGSGPGIGSGVGPGLGSGRGGGRGRGNGHGDGDGDGDGAGDDLLALAPAPSSAPGSATVPKATFDVINVRPNYGVVLGKADRSPVVGWIEAHRKTIPVTMQKPEILNQRSGDATTWVEFDDEQGRHYTLYLLGRNSHPAQLNIFMVTGGKGTLLQDEGAKGETEVYKFGTASGDPRNPTVQLEQLPPGRPEAKQMMAVFTAWWNHTKSADR